METFGRLIGVRGLLALVFSICVMALVMKGIPIPSELYALLGLIVGFYFGGTPIVNGGKNVAYKERPSKEGDK